MTDRWQPTRAGLCNVWRYADEVLTFHRGRMLLRGANGSGKSMALELLLPFLFDASTRPERLTSGTKGRGGLYDRLMAGNDGSGQVGFLWVEFSAGAEVFTIGVRVRASASNRRVDTTWFAAPVAVGRDVHLLDEQRVPLSVQALKATFGEEHVFDSGEDYRRAVRLALFPGYDERQYDAVIATLLSLRREKISQDLSPAKLSEILTESLPPLDAYRLAEVAEGFERIDRRQAGIERLRVDRDEMRKLARRHNSYVRLVLASVVNRVRSAASVRDVVTRDERNLATELAVCREERAEVVAAREAGAARGAELRAEVLALRSRDAYRDGDRIEALKLEAGRAKSRASDAARDAQSSSAASERARTEADDATTSAAMSETNLARATTEATAAADAADGAAMFAEASATTADDSERLLSAWEAAREQAVADVADAVRTHERRVEERTRREEAVEGERADLERAVSAREEADRAVAEARAAYVEDVRAWVDVVGELGDPAVVFAELPAPPDDPDDVAQVVHKLASSAREQRAVIRAGLVRDQDVLSERLAALADERADLATGRVTEPAAPSWRSEGARDGRRGAPLWRLVDVAPGTDPAGIDGVEAGLLASGLLDAWVSPDGALQLADGEADAFLLGGGDGANGPHSGSSLQSVLRPADVDDAPVEPHVVASLLGAIAFVDDATAVGVALPAVGRDGSFQLGPLVGRGDVAPASFVGEAAREQSRRRRIAAIDAESADLERRRMEVSRAIDDVDQRLHLLEAELGSLPAGGRLRSAGQEAIVSAARVADGERRVAAAVEARQVAEEEAKAAQRRLMQVATSHRLPTEAQGLEEYRRRVRDVRDVGAAWIRRRRDASAAAAAASRAADLAMEADRRARDAERVAADARTQADGLTSQVRVLEETVGAEYRELAALIDAAEVEASRLEEEGSALGRREVGLAQREGGLDQQAAAIEERRSAAEVQREMAHQSFGGVVADGLVADSGIDAVVDPSRLSGVTAVLEVAREIAAALGDVAPDDTAISKEQQRLAEAIHGARQGATIELAFEQSVGGWWVLRGIANGLRRPVPEVVAGLEAELAAAEDELRADEKRLFEETLSGSIRQTIADRLRRATALIDGINGALAKVRTEAAGVGVRLRWEVDPEQPEAVRSARKLLLRDAADWSESERTSMFAFFRARLDEAKAMLDGQADWSARLREALDYRHWHRFTLEIAHRDWDGLQPATASRLARLSTGERSIALHLPMLASVAAHYDGASGASARGCPRLILLDELFAGVDAVNRAQLFGMFVTWDLDAVFTSDHEWCAYSSLDGIAIHHLHAAEAGEPVTTARFVWDGVSRRAAPVELLSV